jgi:hypothetical protein
MCSQTCHRCSEACRRLSQICCTCANTCGLRSETCRQRSKTCRPRSQTWCRRFKTVHRHSETFRVPQSFFAGAPRCLQVRRKVTPALRGVPKIITTTPLLLLYQSSGISVTPKAGRDALLGSDTLLKLMHISLHCTSSQTLLEALRD